SLVGTVNHPELLVRGLDHEWLLVVTVYVWSDRLFRTPCLAVVCRVLVEKVVLERWLTVLGAVRQVPSPEDPEGLVTVLSNRGPIIVRGWVGEHCWACPTTTTVPHDIPE